MPHWSNENIQEATIDQVLMKREDSDQTLIRPALHVPETKNISALLSELSRHKTKMAILLNEYGGVSGLVTHEDLAEFIIGDIIDEHDSDDSGQVFEILGRTSTRAVNQKLNLKIDEEIADTIGGYALSLYGRIPSVGDSIEDIDSICFEITALDGNQISALTVRLPMNEAR